MKIERNIRILLLIMAIALLLSSCNGNTVESTDAENTIETEIPQTELPEEIPEDKEEGKEVDLCGFKVNGRDLTEYKILNLTDVDNAGLLMKSALYTSRIKAKIALATEGTKDYCIQVVIDEAVGINKYSISVKGNSIVCATYSKAGITSLCNAFKEFVGQNPQGDYTGDQVFAEGVFDMEDVRKINATEKFITAITDKDPLTYSIGDTITFTVMLYADSKVASCPKFTYEIATDWGASYSGEKSGDSGAFTVSVPASGTGFVRLKVYVKDEKGNLISGVTQEAHMNGPAIFGAGVNVSAIRQEVDTPDDFEQFWKAQVATLDSTAPDLLKLELYREDATHYYYIVKIAGTAECGYSSAYLTYPKAATAKSLGLEMVSFAYSSLDVHPHTSNNNAVLSITPHSIELGQSDSYYSQIASQFAGYGFSGNDTREASTFRPMILRHIQALRFLKAYVGSTGVKLNGDTVLLDLWNGKDIYVWGGSQGGFLSTAIAALDSDVTKLTAEAPWLCDIAGGMGDDSTRIPSVFRPEYTDAMRYFDTVSFAKLVDSNVDVTLIIGLGDYTCPPSGILAYYNTINTKVTFIYRQGGTHGYRPPIHESYEISKNK